MKTIFLTIGFILICLAGIAGLSSWKDETSVGYFKISKNPYGVAIYQDGQHASVQFVGAQSFTVQGNTVTIPSASTITYSRDDIIFDATSIYTEPTQDQIDFLHKPKTSIHNRIIPIAHALYLVNPRIPGMLELRGSNMQIDLDKKQVYGTIITVVVHDTIAI